MPATEFTSTLLTAGIVMKSPRFKSWESFASIISSLPRCLLILSSCQFSGPSLVFWPYLMLERRFGAVFLPTVVVVVDA